MTSRPDPDPAGIVPADAYRLRPDDEPPVEFPRAEQVLPPAPPRLPTPGCPHEDFAAHVEISRLANVEGGPVNAYVADVRVECIGCGLPFVWIGPPVGLSPRQPMTSVDGTELRAPLRPFDAPPDFGTDGPGFHLRQMHP